jgi:hypothetical protein
MGDTLFFLAFSKTNYITGEFKNFISKKDGGDITFKIEGTDNNGTLWIHAILEIRNNKIIKLKWGQKNTMLAPMQKSDILNRILKDFTYEYQWIKVRHKWTKDTSQSIKDKIFRRRLIDALENALFLDNDIERKKRWIKTIPMAKMDLIKRLIPSIKRENIRFLTKKRNITKELDKQIKYDRVIKESNP